MAKTRVTKKGNTSPIRAYLIRTKTNRYYHNRYMLHEKLNNARIFPTLAYVKKKIKRYGNPKGWKPVRVEISFVPLGKKRGKKKAAKSI